MASPLLFDGACFSDIGRGTQQNYNALRRQLGAGCDPAYDYSQELEKQKEMTRSTQKILPKSGDAAGDGVGAVGQVGGLENLRKALREVIGGAAGDEPDDELDADGSPLGGSGLAGSSPAEIREMREKLRPSRSFASPSRADLRKLDLDQKFRAPPIGTYRPKDFNKPKLLDTDFNMREKTRTRKPHEIHTEIARLKHHSAPALGRTKEMSEYAGKLLGTVCVKYRQYKFTPLRSRIQAANAPKGPPKAETFVPGQRKEQQFGAIRELVLYRGDHVVNLDDAKIEKSGSHFKVSFLERTGVDRYGWRTGEDATDRDPVRWKLEGSNDDWKYVVLHEVHDDFQTPEARFEDVGRWVLSDETPVRTATSIELMEGIPDKPKPHQAVVNISKTIERPDIVKYSGIQYHDNSFTAGVLDGDIRLSKSERKPEWDFEKLSNGKAGPRKTYFQPGQYFHDTDPFKARTDLKNIHFSQQPNRKPLRETIGRVEITGRLGDHLPDRSLSRSAGPLLEKRIKGPRMEKYTNRLDIIDKKPPYHNSEDPNVDRTVLQRAMTYDALAAEKPLRARTMPAKSFVNQLNREQHRRAMRAMGDDVAAARAKENLAKGPLSVELLPTDYHTNSQTVKRMPNKDFETMEGRENISRYTTAPSRHRDLSERARFDRGQRDGDARADTGQLSHLAAGITELRAEREHHGLPPEDLDGF